jgi:hypothetical protein
MCPGCGGAIAKITAKFQSYKIERGWHVRDPLCERINRGVVFSSCSAKAAHPVITAPGSCSTALGYWIIRLRG